MMKRGTVKALSVEHENFIGRLFRGRKTKNSGGGYTEPGDARSEEHFLIECKYTGAPGEEIKALPKFVRQLEKIATEAYRAGLDPMLALRYFAPDSILADRDGWVDLVVLKAHDAARNDYV